MFQIYLSIILVMLAFWSVIFAEAVARPLWMKYKAYRSMKLLNQFRAEEEFRKTAMTPEKLSSGYQKTHHFVQKNRFDSSDPNYVADRFKEKPDASS